LILIVQFPADCETFIYSPQKPVVVVFPFPPSLFHGECNSTFLIFHLIYIPRIIWFTNFGSGGQYISLKRLRTKPLPIHLFSTIFWGFSYIARHAPRKFFYLPPETSAFVSLSSLSPLPFQNEKKTLWLVGDSQTHPPVFFIFALLLFPQLTSLRQIASFGIVSRNPSGIPTSRILSR